MVIIGVVSSYIFFETIVGIREGSIIAALTIGALIKFFTMKLTFVDRWLFEGTHAQETLSLIHI